MPVATVMSRMPGSRYCTYECVPVLIAPPNTYTNSSRKAIGMIVVVMMVSRLRVMWRRDRPSRMAVSPKKCLVIVVTYSPVPTLRSLPAFAVLAFVTDDGEEDVLEGRLLFDVFDLGGREQLLELGEG